MLKLNSIICTSVPLLGLDNELMSFGPVQCHLYLFSYGNFEIAEVLLTETQGGPESCSLLSILVTPASQESQGKLRAPAELAEQWTGPLGEGPWAFQKSIRLFGDLTVLQVPGMSSLKSQALDGQGAKVALFPLSCRRRKNPATKFARPRSPGN